MKPRNKSRSKPRRKPRRKTKRRGGNIHTRPHIDDKSAFIEYVDHSDFTVFANGSTGVILKGVIRDVKHSHYYYIKTGLPVKELIFKLCLIHDDAAAANDEDPPKWKLSSIKMPYIHTSAFNQEIIIQNKLAQATIADPICPVIVYSSIYTTELSAKLLEQISKNEKMSVIKQYMTAALSSTVYKTVKPSGYRRGAATVAVPFDSKPRLGIIAMEYVDSTKFVRLDQLFKSEIDALSSKMKNYVNYASALKDAKYNISQLTALGDLPDDLEYELEDSRRNVDTYTRELAQLKPARGQIFSTELVKLRNMARLVILEMAHKTGYTHGDYHFGNILVSAKPQPHIFRLHTEKTHIPFPDFDDLEKVILIDFGYSNKIPHDIFSILDPILSHVYDNVDTIDFDDFKQRISESIYLVHNVSRNDESHLASFPDKYYQWFTGDYECSLCPDHPYFVRESGISDDEYAMMLDILRSRKSRSSMASNPPIGEASNPPIKLYTPTV